MAIFSFVTEAIEELFNLTIGDGEEGGQGSSSRPLLLPTTMSASERRGSVEMEDEEEDAVHPPGLFFLPSIDLPILRPQPEQSFTFSATTSLDAREPESQEFVSWPETVVPSSLCSSRSSTASADSGREYSVPNCGCSYCTRSNFSFSAQTQQATQANEAAEADQGSQRPTEASARCNCSFCATFSDHGLRQTAMQLRPLVEIVASASASSSDTESDSDSESDSESESDEADSQPVAQDPGQGQGHVEFEVVSEDEAGNIARFFPCDCAICTAMETLLAADMRAQQAPTEEEQDDTTAFSYLNDFVERERDGDSGLHLTDGLSLQRGDLGAGDVALRDISDLRRDAIQSAMRDTASLRRGATQNATVDMSDLIREAIEFAIDNERQRVGW